MSKKLRQGLGLAAVITTITIVIFICFSLYENKVNAGNILYATEKQMVSLWTVETVASGPAIVVKNNPSITNAVEAEKAEKAEPTPTAKVIELKPIHIVKTDEYYLDKVRKKLSKEKDISKPSGLPKAVFLRLLRNLDQEHDPIGLFRKNAKTFWKSAHKYGVDELALVAIAAEECGWGSSEKAQATNNWTSQMKTIKKTKQKGKKKIVYYEKKLKYFASTEECIEVTARNLANNYLKKSGKYYNGKTLKAANVKYCEAGYKNGKLEPFLWSQNVYSCMEVILGMKE